MQRFTKLEVWQRSYAFALRIYQVTRTFPAEESSGLTSQLRRSATSVPTNIAEGSKCVRNLEFARFLNIAERSLAETESLLMLSRDLSFLAVKDAASLLQEATEIGSMLNALRRKVEKGRALDSEL